MGATVLLGHGRVSATQALAYTGTSAQVANPFGVQTYQIRVTSTSACYIRIGDGTLTAAATDIYLPANVIDYFIVTPGQSIAAIQAPTNGLVTGTAGTLNVAEFG